jgi:peptide/nickel transport system substrate-binding protein
MDDRRLPDGQEVTSARHARPSPAALGDLTGRMHRLGACGLFCLAAIAAISCSQSSPPVESGPFVARIGVPEASLSTPDSGMMQIASLLSTEGLTERGFDGRARPRLAESWTASPDGLTWRFKLRDGIRFHDGQPVTSEHVVQALNAAVKTRARLGLFPGLADVVGVEAASPREVAITLRRRSTFLLEDLDYAITRRTADKSTIATGAFKTTSASPSEIVMERNEAYHQGAPELARVVMRPYSTVRTAWASLMRGEIDLLYDLSRDAAEFVGSSDVALYSYMRHYAYVIGLNSQRPFFKGTPVRRALNAAIDRQSLIGTTLKGQGLAASSPIWPHHWAYDPSLRGYAFDPSLAGTILDAAGYKQTVQTGKRASRLSFTCILPENWLVWERVALDVQKQLYDVGVDMQLQVVSAEEFDKRLRTRDFDAVMVEMLSGPGFGRPYAFWRWGGEQTMYNVFGYRNADADRWFDAIRSAPGDAEYRVAAGELQRTLLEDPPALFLAWSQRTRAVARRVHIPVESGRDPMTYLWRSTRNGGTIPTTP